MTSKKEQILALRAQGLSYKQIRENTGASLSTISFHCSPGQKEKTAARGCEDCGEKFPYFVLDFDHVRGKKLGNIAFMTRDCTLEQLKEEVAKCDVVCSNCHRFRTWHRAVKSGNSTLSMNLSS